MKKINLFVMAVSVVLVGQNEAFADAHVSAEKACAHLLGQPDPTNDTAHKKAYIDVDHHKYKACIGAHTTHK